jgi:hypothetical protein
LSGLTNTVNIASYCSNVSALDAFADIVATLTGLISSLNLSKNEELHEMVETILKELIGSPQLLPCHLGIQ